MSLRSVNSWNAASMVETWVSECDGRNWARNRIFAARRRLTGIHNQKVLFLVFVYVSDTSEEKSSDGILPNDQSENVGQVARDGSSTLRPQ